MGKQPAAEFATIHDCEVSAGEEAGQGEVIPGLKETVVPVFNNWEITKYQDTEPRFSEMRTRLLRTEQF